MNQDFTSPKNLTLLVHFSGLALGALLVALATPKPGSGPLLHVQVLAKSAKAKHRKGVAK